MAAYSHYLTNKAADELKERLERALRSRARRMGVHHSACARILRRDIEHLGFSRNFTIYDTSDSQSIIKRILKDLDINDKMLPPRSVLSEISTAKDHMISARSILTRRRRIIISERL